MDWEKDSDIVNRLEGLDLRVIFVVLYYIECVLIFLFIIWERVVVFV